MKNKFKFSKNSLKHLHGDDTKPGVHPKVIELANRALDYTTVDFAVIDGYRTVEEQQRYYKEGKSWLDGIFKISDHQRGLAIDILPYKYVDGKKLNMYNIEDPIVTQAWLEVYRAFMRAGMKLGLVLEFGISYQMASGGRDWPHISVKGLTPKNYSNLDVYYLGMIEKYKKMNT